VKVCRMKKFEHDSIFRIIGVVSNERCGFYHTSPAPQSADRTGGLSHNATRLDRRAAPI